MHFEHFQSVFYNYTMGQTTSVITTTHNTPMQTVPHIDPDHEEGHFLPPFHSQAAVARLWWHSWVAKSSGLHPRCCLTRQSRQHRSPPSPKRWVISHDSKRQVLREEILALSWPRSEDLKCLVENVPLLSFVTYSSSHITDSPQRYDMKALDSSPDLKSVNEFEGHYLTLLGAEGWRKSTVYELRCTDLKFRLKQGY